MSHEIISDIIAVCGYPLSVAVRDTDYQTQCHVYSNR